MRLFYHGAAYDRAVLKHILKIYKVTVMHMLSVIIAVMEMYYTFAVRLYNILRQQYPLGYIAADLACHIVTLNAVDGRIFIGIFLLCFFVVALDKRKYLIVGSVGGTHHVTGIAITYITLCGLVSAVLHKLGLDKLLYFLDRKCPADILAVMLYYSRNGMHLLRYKFRLSFRRLVGFGYSVFNFLRLKYCL